MPNFVLPQADVFNERVKYVPDEFITGLRPHIAGGHARLFRYAQAAEKAKLQAAKEPEKK
jgi:hypothetical protein